MIDRARRWSTARRESATASSAVAELRRHNDLLLDRLADLGRATHGLAAELALAKRACRAKEHEIQVLRAENARLVGGPPVEPKVGPRTRLAPAGR